MGFIEETGAAQHYRDVRITTIYEGTTGIQANDLVGRKVGREEGRTAYALIAEMEKFVDVKPLKEATDWIVKNYGANPAAVAAGSVYYLKLMVMTASAPFAQSIADVPATQPSAANCFTRSGVTS